MIDVLAIVLCSSHICLLKRAVESIHAQKDHPFNYTILINVNTLDDDFKNQVQQYAREQGLLVRVTASNGRPGRGHNSCLDIFDQSNFEYMTMLDGDDLYYPYAFHFLNRVITKEPNTDLIHIMLNDNISCMPKPDQQHVPLLVGNFNVTTPLSVVQENFWKNPVVEDPFNVPIAQSRTPSRILMVSRKAIESKTFRYSEEMRLYDDFEAFLGFVEAQQTGQLNTIALSSSEIYCYNGNNDASATMCFGTNSQPREQAIFDKTCRGRFPTVEKDWYGVLANQLPWMYLDSHPDFDLETRLRWCQQIAIDQVNGCHLTHAQDFINKKEYRHAIKHLESYLAFIETKVPDPRLQEILCRTLLNLTNCLIQLGKFTEAQSTIQRYPIDIKSDPRAIKCMVDVLLQMQKWEPCLEYINVALTMFRKELSPTKEHDLEWLRIRSQCLSNIELAYSKTSIQRKASTQKPIVAFYAGMSGPFNGQNYQTQHVYGSEIAMVHLAEELAADHMVFVFCQISEADTVEWNGVQYLPLGSFHAFSQEYMVDYMIVSRFMHFFMHFPVVYRKLIVWVHDARLHDQPADGKEPLPHEAWPIFNNMLNRIDHIVVVSEWHRDVFKQWWKLPEECHSKLVVIGNSIDKSYFDETLPRQTNRMIYCSDTTRGLDQLLDMFPKIKEQVPDATLDIYFTALAGNQPERIQSMKGVAFHGKVPERQLCRELCQSEFWVYPNTSHETYCIVAEQAICAGAIPVCRNFSGVAELVRGKGIVIPGEPTSIAFQQDFVNRIVTMANDTSLKCRLHEVLSGQGSTWTERATEWRKLLVLPSPIGLQNQHA